MMQKGLILSLLNDAMSFDWAIIEIAKMQYDIKFQALLSKENIAPAFKTFFGQNKLNV